MTMFTGHKKLIAGSANRLLLVIVRKTLCKDLLYIFHDFSRNP
jgi:hypothetical protein